MAGIEAYLARTMKNISPDKWDAFVRHLDQRFKVLEEQLGIERRVTEQILQRGLQVIEDGIGPSIAASQEAAGAIATILANLEESGEQTIADGIAPSVAAAQAAATGIEALLASLQAMADLGLDADAVAETATRKWVTSATRGEIIGAIRDGVDASADTLAKLKTLLDAKASLNDITAAIDAIKGTAGALYDTLGEIEVAIGSKLPSASYTATDVLEKLLDVDGDGSGVDADTLDSYEASDFVRTVNGVAPTGGNVNAASIDVQTFAASGTWTKPASGTLALIECWGGGGSGGRSASSNSTGGGGGGYSSRVVPLSSLSATETVTIGAGGPARSGTNGSGTAGGTTTFGAHVSALGGQPGQAGSTPGAGGASTGDFAGGSGADSTMPGTSVIYGGGGGGGRFSVEVSAGGSSLWGGAGGAGHVSVGVAGAQPGGGGGGSGGTSGAGGDGYCRVTVY